MSTPIQNRYDFVYFFDVTDGNPNGDPDAGNLPRIDPETNQGLVTDVCLKRKIRNFVAETDNEKPGQRIYVREKAVLNALHNEAYVAKELKPEPKKLPKDEQKAKEQLEQCPKFHLALRRQSNSHLHRIPGTEIGAIAATVPQTVSDRFRVQSKEVGKAGLRKCANICLI